MNSQLHSINFTHDLLCIFKLNLLFDKAMLYNCFVPGLFLSKVK